MQKDVLYIDVEDDITAIIGKVKAAKQKVVALVPPKRVGVIQSAVNLKLVQRAATHEGKHLVIISNNAALVALASNAGIPVAKNLQSKPEMPEIPVLEIDDGEDIIDGTEVLSEKAPTSATPVAGGVGAAAVAATLPDGDEKEDTPVVRQSASKVPNFDRFRKKLFLIIGCVAALILFLVWAIIFAPSARVIITARTTDTALNSRVTLTATAGTDLKAGTIKAETKTLKKDISIPFTATGKKDVGDKAIGSVKFSHQSLSATTIPAGTQLTSTGGLIFVTDTAVSVPASTFGPGCFPTACAGTATGSVTAAESGTKYNAATGSLSGSGMTATFSGATSGGTDKTVTAVQQSDIDAVQGQVTQSSTGDEAKKQLVSDFGSDYIIVESSFKTDATAVKASPAVGAEAPDGKGALAGSVGYSLTAIPKSEATKYLDAYFAQQIDGKTDQKVYDNGLAALSLTNVNAVDNGNFTASISTNGKVGPRIDENAIKEFAKGRKYGEIQSRVQAVNGIESADIKFSPFWVNQAPNDTRRIQVEFKVNGI